MRMLSLILWVPFFGAVLVALLPAAQQRLIRGVALFHAGLALLLSWSLLVPFDRSTAALQFVEQVVWSSTIGVSYALGVDGLSLPMVLLGTLLFSGSLYVLLAGAPTWLGVVTPVGGLCLILGWLLAARALWDDGAPTTLS